MIVIEPNGTQTVTITLDRLRTAKSRYRSLTDELSTAAALEHQIDIRMALLTDIRIVRSVLADRLHDRRAELYMAVTCRRLGLRRRRSCPRNFQ